MLSTSKRKTASAMLSTSKTSFWSFVKKIFISKLEKNKTETKSSQATMTPTSTPTKDHIPANNPPELPLNHIISEEKEGQSKHQMPVLQNLSGWNALVEQQIKIAQSKGIFDKNPGYLI